MDDQHFKEFDFNATNNLKLNNLKLNNMPTFGNYAFNGQIPVAQKSPFQSISRPSVHFASDVNINNVSSRNTERRPPPPAVQFEDQPSWLDDLLDEPESPVNKSIHRRSRSDSVTYPSTDCITKENFLYPNVNPIPTFDFQKSSYYKELLQNSAHGMQMAPDLQQQIPWNTSFRSSTLANVPVPGKGDIVSKISGISVSQQEQNGPLPEMQNQRDSATQNAESSDVGGESCQNQLTNSSVFKAAEAKRVKQHNARRSRVRKVQYIGELERSIQVLQAEGSMVSAEMEFLDQQILILSMENRALKQRLEGLSQVQLIKSLEQDVLEREMSRLQYLYHQQNICLQQQQQLTNHSNPRRVRSCNDFESQFANLSMRPKEAGSNSQHQQ